MTENVIWNVYKTEKITFLLYHKNIVIHILEALMIIEHLHLHVVCPNEVRTRVD